jgi:predicted small secreted protein
VGNSRLRNVEQHLLTSSTTKIMENDMKKITLFSLLALMTVTLLLGCNAFRGAGKDMSDTGKHIENVGK